MPIQNYPAATLKKAGLNYITLPPQIIQLVKNPISLAIWCYLQSHSEGWICRKESIKNHFDIGDDKYNKAMKELRQLRLVWTENIINPKTGKLLDRRIFCSNIPQPNPECEKPTQGLVVDIKKPSVCFTDLRLEPSLGETHPLINTYKNIINTQEREIVKLTAEYLPPSALFENVSEATATPVKFVYEAWGAFLGHHYGKQFELSALEGAFIKWASRAWHEFGGQDSHKTQADGKGGKVASPRPQKRP